MKKIELTSGEYALVDDKYYDMLREYKWHSHNEGYAVTYVRDVKTGRRITLLMHRLLHPEYDITDHINRDKLDNRDENLREATYSLNNSNKTRQKRTTSKYRGVYWNKKNNKWQAQIRHNGKKINLGNYNDEEEAGDAYILYRLENNIDTLTIFL